MAYSGDVLGRTRSRLATVGKFTSAISYIDGNSFVYDADTLTQMATLLKPSLDSMEVNAIIRCEFSNFVARDFVYNNRNRKLDYFALRSVVNTYQKTANQLMYYLKTISDNLEAEAFDLNAILAVAVHEFTKIISVDPPPSYSRSIRSDYIWEQLWYLTLKDNFATIYPQGQYEERKNKSKGWSKNKRYFENNFTPLKVKSNNVLIPNRFVSGSIEPYNIGVVFPNGDEVYFKQLSLSVLLESATSVFKNFIIAYLENQEKVYIEKLPDTDFSIEQGYSLDKKTGEYFTWSKLLNRRVYANECLEAVEMRELLRVLSKDDSDFVIPDNVLSNIHEGYVAKYIMLSIMLMSICYLGDKTFYLRSILVIRKNENLFFPEYEEGLDTVVLDWMKYLGCSVETDADGGETFHLF